MEKQRRFTTARQYVKVRFEGNKKEIKEDMAAYIDTLPEFEKGSLFLEGLASMPTVEVLTEPVTVRFDKLIEKLEITIPPCACSSHSDEYYRKQQSNFQSAIEESILHALQNFPERWKQANLEGMNP